MESAKACHRFILGAAVALLVVPAAFAQSFPSRPIELVVHVSPGGGTDIIARVVAEILTRERLVSQPVNVINRPGGAGAIAYTYFKGKRGDPHTIMTVASMTLLIQTTRPEMGMGLEHFTPLAFLAQDPQAVMVSADSPFRTLKDLVEAGKREPDSLVASVTSPGGTARMLIWLIERETGARYKVVSFKSGADAILPVMGGHTHFTTENMSEGHGAVEAKKLRVLAVSSAQRLSIVPDVPTLKELGYDIHVGTGRGFAMPADVPKEAAARMEAILERVYRSAAWKEHAERSMYENIWLGSADYAAHLAQRRVLVLDFLQSIGLAPKP
jgi:tripartite-type tricarboxylate transporter receptor subunit TctC